MSSKPIKQPGPDHPIDITPFTGRVVVKVAGKIIADSVAVLELREAAYPPVFYIPRQDVDMSGLQRSEHASYCPYKGDCSYFSVSGAGERARDAVWSYQQPHPAAQAIQNHLAFYPERVEAIEVS